MKYEIGDRVLVVSDGPLRGEKGYVSEASWWNVEAHFGGCVYANFRGKDLMLLCDLCDGTAGVKRFAVGVLCERCSR